MFNWIYCSTTFNIVLAIVVVLTCSVHFVHGSSQRPRGYLVYIRSGTEVCRSVRQDSWLNPFREEVLLVNMLGKKVNGPVIAQNGCLLNYLVEMLTDKLRCETILIMSRESFL